MNFKKRLAFSNAAIIVIPVVVTFVASFLLIFILDRFINVDISYERFKRFSQVQYELFKTDGSILSNAPDKLLEKEFQEYLAARLENIDADIIVLKNHRRVFETKQMSLIDIEKILEKSASIPLSNMVNIDGNRYIVRVININFTDVEKGNIILLAYAGSDWFTVDKFLLMVVIIFIISFLLTNVVLILGFSRSILKPLGKLQEASGKISGGNLDFEVIEDGDDEIRDLCTSFEKMRLKLVESNYRQKKYDDSRKMLLSNISHDLKTPITSIKGYVEGILDGVANTPVKVEKYLKTVYSKSNHVDNMIDDLLLYSKLDLNQVPFNFEKTDVVRYFEDCINEIETELERVNIEIELHNQLVHSFYVMIDRDRLRRVVINILDNSKKYMDKNRGKIDIFLRETNSSIIIEIRDNGTGIAPKDLPHIFDRFYRADSSRTSLKGSGLGLAISKQIIEGHGGEIWAISQKNECTSVMISIRKLEKLI
ncbi:HAMP domain-containing sensor histidine kinase [Herbivorax sp. ANBcel31]|uniref:sensor histidine kinase n=1 Tax=Herbivorax sp. ANBcel31 TaxID=3069754 RepID=UPI0027B1907E|nr:HAMP domain-containing sensor histidine kinase [Herbivorax sp. ANBcel31]MDQ2087790.1 HAMP domain-containing sensor histidine kinase [Herbivorax sp. ANBcel31]